MTPEVERLSLTLLRTVRKIGTMLKLLCVPKGCHLLLLKDRKNYLKKLIFDVGRGM